VRSVREYGRFSWRGVRYDYLAITVLVTTASVTTDTRMRTYDMWRRWRTMIEALMVAPAVMFLPWMMHGKIR
jgi:predicted membrane channel-forming protein YqfA (hemolysin III family)